nr:hypothetical protein [uncultured Methanospirillum sp.]
MGAFIEKTVLDSGFDLCGRMIRQNGDLALFIDGVGRFTIPESHVITVLMGLGECEVSGPVSGCARLSDSGKGFYLSIKDTLYVSPVSRVRAVLSGEHRKGPVSRVKQIP